MFSLKSLSLKPTPLIIYGTESILSISPSTTRGAFRHRRRPFSNLSAIIRIIEGRLLWQLSVLCKSTSHISRAVPFMLLYLLHNMHNQSISLSIHLSIHLLSPIHLFQLHHFLIKPSTSSFMSTLNFHSLPIMKLKNTNDE